MQKLKLSFRQSFLFTYKNTIAFFLLFLATLSIPITVILIKQQQEQRSRAQGTACQIALQYQECIECNTSRAIYKNSCTKEIISGENQNNPDCASLCCTKEYIRKECTECEISQSLYKDTCTGQLFKGGKEENSECSNLCK